MDLYLYVFENDFICNYCRTFNTQSTLYRDKISKSYNYSKLVILCQKCNKIDKFNTPLKVL